MNNLEDLKKWLDDNKAFTEKGLSSGITRKLKNNKDLLDTFKKITGIDTDDPAELIYNVVNPGCDRACKICGAPTTFFKYFYGYRDTCSEKCSSLYKIKSSGDIKLERYGNRYYTNTAKRLATLEKQKNIHIDKKDLPPNQKRLVEMLDNRDIPYNIQIKKGIYFIKVCNLLLSEDELAKDFYLNIDTLFQKIYKCSLKDYISIIKSKLPEDVSKTQYFTADKLENAWHSLKTTESKINTVPLSIVSAFHPSIYRAKVGKNLSIEEAWKDDFIMTRAIRNRLIYSKKLEPSDIIKGLYISKLAPKVSVFNPSSAKYILQTYCTQDTVFDPFSGFSGRMLGACSLGKKYTGQDINKDHVEESNNIIEFFGLDAEVIQKDIFESHGEYPCLFTCSPYGLKETWNESDVNKSCDEWIDECLDRFKCKEYIFVVDKTDKYKEYIVEEITNKSHFNSNKEYIVVIGS